MLNRRHRTFGSFGMMVLKCFVGTAIAFHYAATPTYAVDEIQVYNADIATQGTFTFQQHLNYVWSGNATPDFPGGFASDRTLNGTPELAYGVTDWYELGLYAPFAFDNSGTFLPGGFKVRQLFVSPHAEDRKFFYGVNFELSYQSPRFSQSALGLEIRPILGVRDLGWEFIVNPIVDLSFAPDGAPAFRPCRQARPQGRRRYLGRRRILFELQPDRRHPTRGSAAAYSLRGRRLQGVRVGRESRHGLRPDQCLGLHRHEDDHRASVLTSALWVRRT